MDWDVIASYLPQYEKATWLTLRLGVIGIVWAIGIGLVCAVLQYDKVPVLRRLVGAYIQLSRNTPLLVQLFFIYYGLPKVGIKTNAEICGIAGLAFLGGSYMAEAFRSGLEAIEPIQTESAYSLGMTRLQTLRYVILPQAVSTSVPAFMANVIFLLKETSVFSAVSLMDLMRPHRPVLQDAGVSVPAGGVLPHHPAAGVAAGQLARKEGALCRIWVLRSCSRAKTSSVCWAVWAWRSRSAPCPSSSACRWASCWVC